MPLRRKMSQGNNIPVELRDVQTVFQVEVLALLSGQAGRTASVRSNCCRIPNSNLFLCRLHIIHAITVLANVRTRSGPPTIS